MTNQRKILICYATTFIASACIMVLELVAGRILSRYLGQSLYTWTSVIGVVLAGISVGNYVGGRLADRFEAERTLAVLFTLAALACLVVPGLNRLAGALEFVWRGSWPLRIFIHVTAVFLLPSAILGTISPVVARQALRLNDRTGRTIGGVYACGTAGSILGTFLAGYWLIAALGTFAILTVLSVILAALALYYGIRFWLARLGLVVGLMALGLALAPGSAAARLGGWLGLREAADPEITYLDESNYNYIAIKKAAENPNLRGMYLDKLLHTVVDLSDPLDLQYEYTWVYASAVDLLVPTNTPVSALVIGGGGFAFPQYLELRRPGSRVEVAEIDPAVTRAAFAACGLRPDTTLRIHNMDARNLVTDLLAGRGGLALPAGGFDFVFGDSINDYSVPFHLTTREFAQQVYDLLDEQGCYLFNLIDMLTVGRFLGAVINTCAAVFPEVAVVACHGQQDRDTFVVVCAKQKIPINEMMLRLRAEYPFKGHLLSAAEIARLRQDQPVLTDDYAPVENMLAGVVRQDTGGVVEKLNREAIRRAQAGDLAGAQAMYRKALRLAPAAGNTWYNIGITCQQFGMPREAETAFQTALRINPANLRARNNLALMFAQSGRLAEAIAQWEQVVAVDGCALDVLNNLGNAYALTNDYRRALQSWKQAVTIQPNYADAWLNMATASAAQRNPAQAQQYYEHALQLRPDDSRSHALYGQFLLNQGREDEARRQFDMARQLQTTTKTL